MVQVKEVMKDKTGSIVISVLLGLGLAALFRRACTGDSCVVVKAPSLAEVQRHTYQLGASCYKYTPQVVACPMGGGPK